MCQRLRVVEFIVASGGKMAPCSDLTNPPANVHAHFFNSPCFPCAGPMRREIHISGHTSRILPCAGPMCTRRLLPYFSDMLWGREASDKPPKTMIASTTTRSTVTKNNPRLNYGFLCFSYGCGHGPPVSGPVLSLCRSQT